MTERSIDQSRARMHSAIWLVGHYHESLPLAASSMPEAVPKGWEQLRGAFPEYTAPITALEAMHRRVTASRERNNTAFLDIATKVAFLHFYDSTAQGLLGNVLLNRVITDDEGTVNMNIFVDEARLMHEELGLADDIDAQQRIRFGQVMGSILQGKLRVAPNSPSTD